jgi:hypothetical protein
MRPPGTTASTRRWSPVAGIGPVIVIAFVPCLVVAVITGGWGVPENDDWDYTRAALALHATGHLRLVGWGEMTLVGQLLLSQPLLFLHASVGTLDAFGMASAVVFVVGLWLFARTLLRPGWALLVAAVAAACPITTILSTTFMTDLPSAALQTLCLAFGAMSFERGSDYPGGYSPSWYIASMSMGLLACTIRETALAAPLAVGLVALWQGRRVSGRLLDPVVCLTGLAVAAGVIAVVEWRAGLPGSAKLHLSFVRHPDFILLGPLQQSAVLVLCLLPLLVALPWLRLMRRAGIAGSLVAVVAGIPAIALGWHFADRGALFPGNLLTLVGPGGQVVLTGVRPALFGAQVWLDLERLAATALGLFVATIVIGAAAARRRRAECHPPMIAQAAIVLVLVLTMVLAFAASILSTGREYDRYVIPLLIPFTLLICWIGQSAREPDAGARRRGTAVGGSGHGPAALRRLRVTLVAASLVLLAVVGFIEAASGDAYDAGRWRAGEMLVAAHPGTAPDRFDAGFEWVGFHAPLPLRRPAIIRGVLFYDLKFGIALCEIVSNSPGLTGVRSKLPVSPLTSWTDVYGNVHELYVIDVAACPT